MPRSYPSFYYFPRTKRAPAWVEQVLGVFESARNRIDARKAPHKKSNEVLAILRPGLEKVGFKVESGPKQDQKLHRPVYFAEMGIADVKYEIDAFNPEHGIVVEVEAGRSVQGNAIYRDIIRTSLMIDARYSVIAMPIEYKFGKKGTLSNPYDIGVSALNAIWSSERLRLPFEGMLLVGY
jgi:hypothetical protein